LKDYNTNKKCQTGVTAGVVVEEEATMMATKAIELDQEDMEIHLRDMDNRRTYSSNIKDKEPS
jgi:hypothetical protein